MKRITLLFALVSVWFCGFAQVSTPSTPPSFTNYLSTTIPTHYLSSVDETKLLKEDEAVQMLDKSQPLRFGQDFTVYLDLSNSGLWETLPNGDRVWRLKIASQGAKSLNFIFSKFYMPEGGEFFIYNEDKTYTIGAFTSQNNKSHGEFSTAAVKGSTVILEYYEPLAVKNQGVIAVSSIIHAYRNIFAVAQNLQKGFGDSGSCNIDVNCPQGAGWENEISSVALIMTAGNTSVCTGAMVNNTAQDKTPYFLTANHCLGGNSNTWVFVFNYESPTCNGVDGSLTESISGSTTKANYAASDMGLLELSMIPPDSYNVFYSGWDKSGVAPSSAIGIHHPSGDVKKISFDNDPLINGIANGTNYWRVSNWEDGTTEGGSSGSPLYDPNHRIVGQLFGGAASCNNNAYDEYGKFSVSWTGGGTPSTSLMSWLDPTNTGVAVLDGNSFSCGASALAATSTTNSSVLTWNANIDTITNFTIQYRAVNGTNWVTLPVSDTILSRTITGLLPCTDYEFQVDMDCDTAWSGFTSSFVFTTDGCCNAPTNFVMSNVTDTTATITGGNITAALSYDMQYREQGTTAWIAVNGLTSPIYNFTGLTPCIVYEVEFRTNCTGTTTPFGNTFVFNSGCGQCGFLTYCGSQGNNVSDEWIEEVVLNTINNNSGVGTAGYTDFTTVSTTLVAGQVYNISLSQGYSGTPFPEYFNVWIDFDQSGTFDNSEKVYTSGETTTFPNTGMIVVPMSALSGGTTMRVSMRYNNNGTACQTFAFGEVEDYCIIIDNNTAPCAAPSNLQATVTTTAVNTSWGTVATAVDYNLRYRKIGAANWTDLMGITTSQSTLSTLDGCSDYEFQVQTNCGNGALSIYSTSFNFTTSCICDDVTNLDTMTVNSNTALLNWTAVANGQTYTLEYKQTAESAWTSQTPTTSTVAQLTNLQPATYYDARVIVACPNNTTSNYSNILNFYTDWTTNTNGLPADLEQFETYPNPFDNQIKLMINTTKNQKVTIQLFNIEGKLVQTQQQNITQGLNTLQVSTNQFTSGIYILRLVTEAGVVSKRILKN